MPIANTRCTDAKAQAASSWFASQFLVLRLLCVAALMLGCTQTALAAEGATDHAAKGVSEGVSTGVSTGAAETQKAKPELWTDQEIDAQRALDERANPAVQIRSRYALGVNRYYLNHSTRLIGWQVGESLYFGRAKGEESGIALVWQRRWNQQVSLSNDGIRLTRHF